MSDLADDADVKRHNVSAITLPPDMPWPARWAAFDKAIRASWPRASVVVLTHDNLGFLAHVSGQSAREH